MQVKELAAIALVSGLVAWIIGHVIESRRHAAKARELRCEPPVRAMSKDPSGVVMLYRGVMASRNKIFLDFALERMDEVSEKEGRPVGTIMQRSPFFRDTIFTHDPKNIQAILAVQFKEFGFGINRTENFKPLLGNGIFAANGKQWEHSRAMLRPQFVRSQVSDLDLEEGHVQAMMQVLESKLGADRWTSTVDMQVLLFRLTLDSATEFLFGESVQSQLDASSNAAGSETRQSFASSFDSSQARLAIAARMGTNYWLIHTPEFHRQVKKVHDFVDYFVKLALRKRSDGKTSEENGHYVFLNGLAEQTQDPVELRSQLLNILLAGRDTTASTLGWFFYTMAAAHNKHRYDRLRAIILDSFGTYSNAHGITFESMKSCQYLQWCISECLRLYPVVPVNSRTAQVDTTLPTGGGPDGTSPVYVKKGTDIGYSVHLMHRRKDLWGPDAREFKPERWEKRRPGWEYLPFNGGPRICIGQQFALTEVAYVIIRCVQRIEAIDGSQIGPIRHGLTLTNCPGNGVNVRLRFAKD